VSAHTTCGRGTLEDGPEHPDCPHRGTPAEGACADGGCGFCRAARHQTITARVRADWRYAYLRANPRTAVVAETLSADLGLAIRRMRDTLDALGRRGGAGVWLDNDSLLAHRRVLEELTHRLTP
jgi:hypothetical protein